MSRGLEVSLLALMLLATALSGCISSDDDSSNGDGDEEPVDEEFLGLDYVECMIHEDLERCWNVLVPSTVNLSEQVPMIIDLHGNTVTMENQRGLSEFDEIAEEKGAIAVWPQGFDNSWNAGYCCSSAGELQLNDTGFILEIVNKVVTNHSVDENRIYLTGWSNAVSYTHLTLPTIYSV